MARDCARSLPDPFLHRICDSEWMRTFSKMLPLVTLGTGMRNTTMTKGERTRTVRSRMLACLFLFTRDPNANGKNAAFRQMGSPVSMASPFSGPLQPSRTVCARGELHPASKRRREPGVHVVPLNRERSNCQRHYATRPVRSNAKNSSGHVNSRPSKDPAIRASGAISRRPRLGD